MKKTEEEEVEVLHHEGHRLGARPRRRERYGVVVVGRHQRDVEDDHEHHEELEELVRGEVVRGAADAAARRRLDRERANGLDELARLHPLLLLVRHEGHAGSLVAQPVELVDDDAREELEEDEAAERHEDDEKGACEPRAAHRVAGRDGPAVGAL